MIQHQLPAPILKDEWGREYLPDAVGVYRRILSKGEITVRLVQFQIEASLLPQTVHVQEFILDDETTDGSALRKKVERVEGTAPSGSLRPV